MILITSADNEDNKMGSLLPKNTAEVLGLPNGRPLHICFPANNFEQFAFYSMTMAHDPMTKKLIIFETEDAVVIDRIKLMWAEHEAPGGWLHRTDMDKDWMNIEHPDCVEYIIAGLPDDRFEFDFDLPTLMQNYKQGEYPEKVIKILDKCIPLIKDAFYTEVINKYLGSKNPTVEIRGTDASTNGVTFDWIHSRQYAKQKVFATYAAPFIYGATLAVMGYKYQKNDTPAINMPGEADSIDLPFTLTDRFDFSDKESIAKALRARHYALCEILLRDSNMPAPAKVYPNDPCPCGSGLKYKKCCMHKYMVNGRDVAKLMSATEPTHMKAVAPN